MGLRLRFIGNVDRRLRPEVLELFKWLRSWYRFPTTLEIRLVHQSVLIDFDGTECALRWWQSSGDGEPVTGEIAVGSFPRNMKDDGPQVAFPTVIAAVGRVLKYYYQVIRDSPERVDYAELWGDKMLDAYTGGTRPPEPWKGAWLRRNGRNPSPSNRPMQTVGAPRRR